MCESVRVCVWGGLQSFDSVLWRLLCNSLSHGPESVRPALRGRRWGRWSHCLAPESHRLRDLTLGASISGPAPYAPTPPEYQLDRFARCSAPGARPHKETSHVRFSFLRRGSAGASLVSGVGRCQHFYKQFNGSNTFQHVH